ncbi:carbon monoxide dehydrogenase maturation protein [Amycolatopsis sp. CA-161197]|uniref:carbon monoxide dehydrogenase maturation protein n=1 Tax=Amycolatopsis sp. CA-161197 TaxID=3239922 RepID=UPI003D8D0C23
MLVALCSLKGSPGVTTVAVALATQWPRPELTYRLVAEVDPSGGDLAMRFGVPATPGLVSLAAVARRTGDPTAVWEHTRPLPDGVRMLLAPPGGVHARAALHTMAAGAGRSMLRELSRDPRVVVLADCGRIDPGSPAEAVARQSDTLLVLTRTHAEDLAHAAARLTELAGWTPRPGLLLVGEGYPTADVERGLGVPAVGRIPHDPAVGAVPGGRRRRRPGALDRQAALLARSLVTGAPTSTLPSPVGGLFTVPGGPSQQVRLPGGEVVRYPHPPLQHLRPVPMPPARDVGSARNGHPLRVVGRDSA